MNKIRKEFVKFITNINKKLTGLQLDLDSFPIDHICYRVSTFEDYIFYKELFSKNSILYTEKYFHERYFHTFVLQKPLIYKDFKFCYLEFAQPGGSDNYDKGFQHIEFLTNKRWPELINGKDLESLFFVSKHGEEYLKWNDKISIKLTGTPQITKALLEDNPKVILC